MDHKSEPPHLPAPALTRYQSGNHPFYVPAPLYPFENVDDSGSGSGLLAYWRIVSSHKKAVAISSLAGLIVGVAIGIPMKPVFRARTSVEVLNVNQNFMNMKSADPVTTNDGSWDTSEEETQAKLIQGESLLDRVSAKLDPDGAARAPKSRSARTGWRSWLHLREPAEQSPREKLIGQAIKTLNVRNTPRTRLLEITVDSTDPQFAATFANDLIQEFTNQSMEARWSATQHTSAWLAHEIDDLRKNLRASEGALQAYARDSGLIFTDTSEETNVATEKLQQVQQALSVATADRISKQSRFELAKNSPPDTLADILSDQGLQDLAGKLDDARRDEADLNAIYNPQYSRVKRAHAEVSALENAFLEKRTDIVKRIENDYNQAVKNEKLLAATYDAQAREVTGQDEKTIQYNILKRDADSNRQLYDTMLQQMKQASVASALHASNVRVVDPAVVSATPVFPNFKLNGALGFLSGALFSVSLVILRDRADRTLQQPGDIKLWTDTAELGTIPNAASMLNVKTKYVESPGQPEDRRLSLAARGQTQRVELITSQQTSSIVSEAFRSALTSILFVGENGSRPRTLVFTSAHPSDGKTTTVSNLAIAIAEIRRKVLVIDADLRRPRMHDIFNLENDRGLVNILRDKPSEENALSFIQQTAIDGLHVMTGGEATHAAAHLLYSPNFAAFLAKCKNEYDMILIDTPPMLQMTDARVVGRLADAVVLVARAGKTTRDAMLAAKQRFAEDHIRVLGSILNNWDPKQWEAGYYGYGSTKARSHYYSAPRGA